MLTVIAIMLPPILIPIIHHTNNHRQMPDILTYACGLLIVNLLMMAIACFGFGNTGSMASLLSQNAVFWVKWVLAACLLSAVLGYLSIWVERNVEVQVEVPKRLAWRWTVPALVAFAAALFAMHFARIFNFDFWGDEAYSILLARMSVPDMLTATAEDVHPPLYYLLLMGANRLFGDAGWGYNLVSLVPYGIALVLALSVVRDRFGGSTAVVLVACQSLTAAAVTYNVEVRMYSWAALFVLIAYLWLLKVIERGKPIDWVVFCLASLAAAYTHYYALMLVGFLYLGLVIFTVLGRKPRGRVIVACVGTLVGYAPWLLALLRTLGRTAGNFWMTEVPSLEECLRYPFDFTTGGGALAQLLLLAFALGFVALFLRGAGAVRVDGCPGSWRLTLSGRIHSIDDTTVWVAIGALGVLATIVVGLAASELVRPLLSLRYIYPACPIIWLLLGVVVSQFGCRRVLSLLLVATILWAGIPGYLKTWEKEKDIQNSQASTIAAMGGVKRGDVLLTDIVHLSWSVLQCDFPETNPRLITPDDLPSLDSKDDYWLVLSSDISDGYLTWLEGEGYWADEVAHEGWIGRDQVHVYRLDAVGGGEG